MDESVLSIETPLIPYSLARRSDSDPLSANWTSFTCFIKSECV